VFTTKRLFSAPSQIQPAKHVIETSEAKNLAAHYYHCKWRQVLAYGNAGLVKLNCSGVIKVFAIRLCRETVSVEAVTWLLEMNATHKRALLQLTNELAVNCGTPFLIQSAEKPDLYRNFSKSLKMASNLLPKMGYWSS